MLCQQRNPPPRRSNANMEFISPASHNPWLIRTARWQGPQAEQRLDSNWAHKFCDRWAPRWLPMISPPPSHILVKSPPEYVLHLGIIEYSSSERKSLPRLGFKNFGFHLECSLVYVFYCSFWETAAAMFQADHVVRFPANSQERSEVLGSTACGTLKFANNQVSEIWTGSSSCWAFRWDHSLNQNLL